MEPRRSNRYKIFTISRIIMMMIKKMTEAIDKLKGKDIVLKTGVERKPSKLVMATMKLASTSCTNNIIKGSSFSSRRRQP